MIGDWGAILAVGWASAHHLGDLRKVSFSPPYTGMRTDF